MSDSLQDASDPRSRLSALALGAIGVVYGDLGTSPLYTMKETFGVHGLPVDEVHVLGVLSLVFWTLMLVVSLKYAGYIMRADNKGEGGIMALTALAQRGVRGRPTVYWLVTMLGLFGAALFFGDGVITPAISVLSAVEGVKVAAPQLDHFIVPITVVILLGLFWIQKRGSGRVGLVFGPIMCLWFVSIAVLGVIQIFEHPYVLKALSPHYALHFFTRVGWPAFFALGSVVLCITGAEALYADMGHFGKKPIRMAWFGFVMPALVLNYFGQGALLLSNGAAVENPFFMLAPQSLLLPFIALATLATVIASQSVISGAYSVAREAIQLGFLPRMQVQHTSAQEKGQVYLPWINRLLLVLTLAVVLGFQSSTNLAAAYGIAVVGTMTIDAMLVMIVFRKLWNWNPLRVAVVGLVFLIVDLAFLTANADKVEHGGWFPLVLGAAMFTVMTTWRRGRELVMSKIRQAGLALEPFIASIVAHPPLRVPGTAVFLTSNAEGVPNALLHNLKHNKVLHERNIILTVETVDTPTVEPEECIEVQSLGDDFYSVFLRFGFAEDMDVPQALAAIKGCGPALDMMDTTFFLSRESIVANDRSGMALWRDKLFAFLQRNAMPATAFFRVPGNRLIELGTQVEI
ncbi:MAG: potassium transporter Kup [Dokdonella sp.]|uniref:potassium transporter Kup n=1 Tax=Dokdonella sp. TaxID=2291710 RepID=UPI0025C1BCB2|nr:potassium transporter Kup [Dokdonella sp.]MBZ0223359.1 potassium transporter Kup [Dokdonella sp.]MCC7255798.1 potassium transporter Kup [Dokdonella sp.]